MSTIQERKVQLMNEQRNQECPRPGMYDPSFEHDNCGIGAVVNIKGVKSHKTVEDALSIVENLEHRAGKDAEGKTGDGVGIMVQISHKFFSKECAKLGIELGGEREYGIGMFFLPQDELKRNQAKKMFEIIVEKEGMNFLGWREVTTNPKVLGSKALEKRPSIMQAFIQKPEDVEKGLDFDRKLYIARRVFEQSIEDTYVVSCSSRTLIYKGMFLVGQLRSFFQDLQSPDYESAIALVHSRFSTNTMPSWERAHPYRFLVHNGEINTIKGNADKMLAREETVESEHLKGEFHKILPVISASGSDSAMLDNTLEFLVMSGMDLPLAVMIMLPAPWAHDKSMPQEVKDFYHYYATMMEPWDGPASILFTDGDVMGAVLDRNGLRPSRYYITNDDRLILSSEVGVLDIPTEKIVKKERLRPGKMLLVDTVKGELVDDDELKERYAARQPYGEWIDANLVRLRDIKIPNHKVEELKGNDLTRMQRAFGYTYEEVMSSILSMARTGQEPIASMGTDTPLAVLSKTKKSLFNYFKQNFAQVTNPPIDAIREKIVTSTITYLGGEKNLLKAEPQNCKRIRCNSPILTNKEMADLKAIKENDFKAVTISMLYNPKEENGLETALDKMFEAVDIAMDNDYNIIVLSDKGVDENKCAIPALLAGAGVHHHLIRNGKRMNASIILETGEPREVHHFAVLLGYGVNAVNPYLAYETLTDMAENKYFDKTADEAVNIYRNVVTSGIVKIMSKMGISTIQSYQGAQIFEALGVSESVVDKYFTGTVTRIGGIDINQIDKEAQLRHEKAFDPLKKVDALEAGGNYKWRKDGECHMFNPKSIYLLQRACREGDYKLYKEFAAMENDTSKQLFRIRGMLDIKTVEKPINIDEVESVESIVKRFKTGAMSYGSISKEAHECMAIAMNRLGGKSNSGEGGEEAERFTPDENGDLRRSAIKQVASGRFGVTIHYLQNAVEIQIKMAQGAKPGEGGHLPGKKVYPWIAKARNSTPGVSLISPPPHHDIYSIEDLAQLIHDCKNANRDARISVKLVSEAGVGTIAVGVAKGRADVILISGYDGGTGAAPRTGIRHAGLPWELGVAETHQALLMNNLRNRVVIETDGKLLTGRDVAVACLLGAEEFGFATGPLITMGCVMMRVCNLDTCPVGVATQNPELRAKFKGKPEYVENFMRFIAQDLREWMAKIGVKSINEMVGHVEKLAPRKNINNWKAKNVDLAGMLYQPKICSNDYERYFNVKQDHELEKCLDVNAIVRLCQPAIKNGKKISASLGISNTDRVCGTILSSEITKVYGVEGLPEDTINLEFVGSAGQSFGAFQNHGVTMKLYGDSNDYIGKGLSGGKIIVVPPKDAKFVAEDNVIIGNVAFYGAIDGEAYINGMAGERFCVRNSGISAVVEGIGHHGCEYMTGGRVAILGKTGINFGAGMSGGIAYVYNYDGKFESRCNKSGLLLEEMVEDKDIAELKKLIENHLKYTNSKRAKAILENWDTEYKKFVKVIPQAYKEMITEIEKCKAAGMTDEEARLDAFRLVSHTAPAATKTERSAVNG